MPSRSDALSLSATTFWMILMLPLAYGASRLRLEWFFPAMLFISGDRYPAFATLFGTRIFGFAERLWLRPTTCSAVPTPRPRSPRWPPRFLSPAAVQLPADRSGRVRVC